MDMSPGVVLEAANIRTSNDAASVSSADFLAMYPQFSGVPSAFLDMTLDRANASIMEGRWHNDRKFGVCLYTAHFCTLWLQTYIPTEQGATPDPGMVAESGDSKEATSKSVDGVSVSYSASDANSDLVGYGAWKLTKYGVQLAQLAKLHGAGMMVIR